MPYAFLYVEEDDNCLKLSQLLDVMKGCNMNKELLSKWAGKEKELQARLETLHTARDQGFNLQALEFNTRLLMQEVINLRGELENEVTDEDIELLELHIAEGGSHETF